MSERGWRPDPSDPRTLRFWDGANWTDYTKPNPDGTTAAPPAPQGNSAGNPGGAVRLPGHGNGAPAAPAQPSASTPPAQHDPYAASQPHSSSPSPHDPYAGQAQQHSPNLPQHDPYAAQGQQPPQPMQTRDPYAGNQAQQAPPQPGNQQPGYLQQDANPQGFAAQVHRFNDSIAQGYGDQSFGGQMSGPAGHRQAEAGRNVMNEKTLIVSQKRKIIEVTNEYTVYGADGSTLGAVVQVGQSSMRKALRVMTNYDQFLTHRLEVRDNNGRVLLQLTRPAKFMKSSVIVQDAQGREIGRLVQRNVFGKIKFGMESNGQEVGSLNAENWRAWNFAVLDNQGTEIARVTKTWEGLLTTMFTTADNYAVNIHYDLPEPLRSLCVAAALTIDTALKQDDR
ncbi:DUF2510 domain-containing protein [Yimella sp. cx-573]|nr:DUF2510 domain-containing protein [Yimella sp. cx-573]